jgi:hypothetical protein
MPFTMNGCGTKYYGHRDDESDGSYVTTEWIVFVYLPLIPIGSFRVRLLKPGFVSEYHVWRVPFHWMKIRNVYLVSLIIWSIIFVWMAIITNNINNDSKRQLEPAKHNTNQVEQSR